MEQKKILKSQQELIRLKVAQAQGAQAALQATINQVALELGLDPEEHWRLSADGTAFEKPEPPKKPDLKIPGKKG